MSALRSLFKQTFIYGFSTIALRMLTWGLTFYFTHYMGKKMVGMNADLLSWTAFLNVVFMFGMETTFFRFIKDYDEKKVFATTSSIVFFNSLILSLILALFAKPIASLLGYPNREIYFYLIAGILFFENTSNIPFASLRHKEQAIKFMRIKAYNVLLNVGLTIFLISYVYTQKIILPFSLSNDPNVLILTAILIPWVLTFIYFSRDLFSQLRFPDRAFAKEVLSYSYPLVIVGLAGMVNELADRQFLKYLLPYSFDKNLEQLGLYNVNYKLSIVITLAIQAFRMGAEPFFFKQANDKEHKKTYAVVMDFFIIVCTVIMTTTNLLKNFMSDMLYEASYKEGLTILPILLLANIFLGIYYNTTIWFKLTNQTNKGALITLIGAAVSIATNLLLIPKIGYMGAAYGHLFCYLVMLLFSLYWGQKYYPIPYSYTYNVAWIILSLMYSYWVEFFLSSHIALTLLAAAVYIFVATYFGYRRLLFIKNQAS